MLTEPDLRVRYFNCCRYYCIALWCYIVLLYVRLQLLLSYICYPCRVDNKVILLLWPCWSITVSHLSLFNKVRKWRIPRKWTSVYSYGCMTDTNLNIHSSFLIFKIEFGLVILVLNTRVLDLVKWAFIQINGTTCL